MLIELVLHLAFGALLGWIIHDLVLSYRRVHTHNEALDRGGTPCPTCQQTPTNPPPAAQKHTDPANPWLTPLAPANPWLTSPDPL